MALAETGAGLFHLATEAGAGAGIDNLRRGRFQRVHDLAQRAHEVAARAHGEVAVGDEVRRQVFDSAAGLAFVPDDEWKSPEMASWTPQEIERLLPRVVPGGFLIVDDTDWFDGAIRKPSIRTTLR